MFDYPLSLSKRRTKSLLVDPTPRTITVSAQLHYARFYDMPQNPGGGQDWTQQREAGAAEDTSVGA